MLRIGDKNVLFSGKSVSLISFSAVSGDDSNYVYATYFAEEGMTWEEFINSEYNSDGDFYTSGGYIAYKTGEGKIAADQVKGSDMIRDGVGYMCGNLGAVYDPDTLYIG